MDNETPGIGHNVAADRLRSLVDRIERLEDEKKILGSDIKDIMAEAKSSGYDVKALRAVLQLRKMDASAREEREMLIDTYMRALGQ